MGSFEDFDRLCRLCGRECYDLINLFEMASHQRNLTVIIKKYIRVTVSLQDSLPQHICGPCLAKLDEVVDFVDVSHATQRKLTGQLRECPAENKSVQVNEDKLYELIQDVKVELEESESPFIDDLNDESYGPSRQRRRKAARGVRGREQVVVPRGRSNKPFRRVKSKEVTQGAGGVKEKTADTTVPPSTPLKAEQWMGNNTIRKEVVEAHMEDSLQRASYDKLGNSTKSAVRCSLCKSSFKLFEDLQTHCMQAHQLSEYSFLCPQCPLIFHKIPSLRTHQRREHQNSLQTCPHCNKLYSAHYLWTRHILVHTNLRPFSCDECKKKFKSKAEMFNHKRIHRPSEERYTHCCEVCGKRFTQKANLESHLRLHTGNRPFSCEFCGKCFSQRGNMEEHRRIHTGEKPFVCNVCGVRYSRQGQLAMHRRQHSGEKPHKCQYCEKQFLRREVLRKHEHVHTDTRPYKCSYCEKSFRDQGKRKVHERLHTGERPFECQFCGRGFCESGNLRKHMRIHQRRPSSVASSTTQDKDQGSFPSETGPPGAPYRSHSFRFTSACNKTLNVPELTAPRHGTKGAAEGNSSMIAITDSVSLVPVNSHPVSRPQESTTPAHASLPLLRDIPTHNHSLTTLHQEEDSQECSTMPPQECEREEYNASSSSSYQSATSWTLYQA